MATARPCEWCSSPRGDGDAPSHPASAAAPRGIVMPGGASPSCAPRVTMHATGRRLRAALQASFGVEACANGDVRMFRVEFPGSGRIGLTLRTKTSDWLAPSPAPATVPAAQAQPVSEQCVVLRTSTASLSAAMGVRTGDVVLQLNGQTLRANTSASDVGSEMTRCRRAGRTVSITFARHIGRAGLGMEPSVAAGSPEDSAHDSVEGSVEGSVDGSIEGSAGLLVEGSNEANNKEVPAPAVMVTQSSFAQVQKKQEPSQVELKAEVHRHRQLQLHHKPRSEPPQQRPDDKVGRPTSETSEAMRLSSRALPHSISEARARNESDALMRMLQSPFKMRSTNGPSAASPQSRFRNADAEASTDANVGPDARIADNAILRARLEAAEAQALAASHWEMVRRKEVIRSNMAEAEVKEELATAHRLVGMLRTRLLEVQLQSRKGYVGEGDGQGSGKLVRIDREANGKGEGKGKGKGKAKRRGKGKGKGKGSRCSGKKQSLWAKGKARLRRATTASKSGRRNRARSSKVVPLKAELALGAHPAFPATPNFDQPPASASASPLNSELGSGSDSEQEERDKAEAKRQMRRRLRKAHGLGRGGQPRRVGGGYVYKSPPPSPRVTPPKPKPKPVVPPPHSVRIFARGDNGDEFDTRALATARLQALGTGRSRPAQAQTHIKSKRQAATQGAMWMDSDGNLYGGDEDAIVTAHPHRARRPRPHSCFLQNQVSSQAPELKFIDALDPVEVDDVDVEREAAATVSWRSSIDGVQHG